MRSLPRNSPDLVLEQIRSGSTKMSFQFWVWYATACLFVVSAWIAVLASSQTAAALLAPVPFFLVTALMLDQKRRNAALLAEIDRLRELVQSSSGRTVGQEA